MTCVRARCCEKEGKKQTNRRARSHLHDAILLTTFRESTQLLPPERRVRVSPTKHAELFIYTVDPAVKPTAK